MRDGSRRFYDAVRSFTAKPASPVMPKPTDAWGAWVEFRLDRLQAEQSWLIRLLVGALALQVGLKVLDLLK